MGRMAFTLHYQAGLLSCNTEQGLFLDDSAIHDVAVCFWDKNHFIVLAPKPCDALKTWYGRTIFSFSALGSCGTCWIQNLFVPHLKNIHLGSLLNVLWMMFFFNKICVLSGKYFLENFELWQVTVNALLSLKSKSFLNVRL